MRWFHAFFDIPSDLNDGSVARKITDYQTGGFQKRALVDLILFLISTFKYSHFFQSSPKVQTEI